MTLMNETTIILMLVLSGIVVGVINTLAGGGAIITMTLFMVLGLPINVANGTNRIAVVLQNTRPHSPSCANACSTSRAE